jgi:hypothetical protein
MDEAIQYVWVFLMASKDPPLDIVREFCHLHGHEEGGSIRNDQGGKLARSLEFQDLILWTFYYTLEPMGAGSLSKNGVVENYNDKFAVRTQTLLLFGYLVGGYEFVVQVRIHTPYAGGFGMAIPNQQR